jgi:hypothetical protein
MTQPISTSTASSFATGLAELLLNVETVRSDSAQLERDSARKDFLEQAEHQVQALHEAADDVRTGAWVAAAFTVASSVVSIEGAVSKYNADMDQAQLNGINPRSPCKAADALALAKGVASASKAANLLLSGSKLLEALASPAKQLLGDAPADDANANAKLFETLAEKAKWAAGDASTEIDQAAQLTNKLLDLVQGIHQDQNTANNALIGRV